MDGENNGKPYENSMDLGGKSPYFWFNTHRCTGLNFIILVNGCLISVHFFSDIFTGGMSMHPTQSGWWFFPTHLENMLVKLDHFPKPSRGENVKKYLKTTI